MLYSEIIELCPVTYTLISFRVCTGLRTGQTPQVQTASTCDYLPLLLIPEERQFLNMTAVNSFPCASKHCFCKEIDTCALVEIVSWDVGVIFLIHKRQWYIWYHAVRTQTSLAPVCSIYETIIDSKLLSISELITGLVPILAVVYFETQ